VALTQRRLAGRLDERIDAAVAAARRRVARDDAPAHAFRIALALSVPVMYLVGRRQWFIRDDWAFVLTRARIREDFGWDQWLLEPTAGHWMTVPILLYRGLEELFGIDSYWPYLALNMALHLAIVVAVRALCGRVGVSPWTATLVCSGVLVFGAGWENIVFAIQITYHLTTLGFLLQLLLVDHDGPPDRRDVLGAAAALVGAMSSAFGPFFVLGVGALLALRRRWSALLVATVPSTLALAWWWITWGHESPEEDTGGTLGQVPLYATRGALAVFESLSGIQLLGGVAALAAVAVALRRQQGWRRQSLLLALWTTAAAMYVGLGLSRSGFGVENAAVSRYQYMGAVLLAPAFALAVDQLRRISTEAHHAGRALLVVSAVLSLSLLRVNSVQWAIRATDERNVLELIAGSDLLTQVGGDWRPLPFSPDVRIADLERLVRDGAITPRAPATPEELALVRSSLGLAPQP